jgi:hypothetical protein
MGQKAGKGLWILQLKELPAYYAKRTLLNETILPEDIAMPCFAFVVALNINGNLKLMVGSGHFKIENPP